MYPPTMYRKNIEKNNKNPIRTWSRNVVSQPRLHNAPGDKLRCQSAEVRRRRLKRPPPSRPSSPPRNHPGSSTQTRQIQYLYFFPPARRLRWPSKMSPFSSRVSVPKGRAPEKPSPLRRRHTDSPLVARPSPNGEETSAEVSRRR